MDNPETGIGNIGHTRYRTKTVKQTNKIKTQKTKKIINTDPTKKQGVYMFVNVRLAHTININIP